MKIKKPYWDDVYLVIELPKEIFDTIDKYLIDKKDNIKFLLSNSKEHLYLEEMLKIDINNMSDYYKLINIG